MFWDGPKPLFYHFWDFWDFGLFVFSVVLVLFFERIAPTGHQDRGGGGRDPCVEKKQQCLAVPSNGDGVGTSAVSGHSTETKKQLNTRRTMIQLKQLKQLKHTSN